MKTFIITCIYHQSKETFWLFSYDAIFTTFATIFIFFVGMLANALFAWKKEKNRLALIKEFFLTNLNHLLEPIETQVQYYIKLSNELKDENCRVFNFYMTSDILLNPLLDIDTGDLFKIFVQNRNKSKIQTNIMHFRNIISSIEPEFKC